LSTRFKIKHIVQYEVKQKQRTNRENVLKPNKVPEISNQPPKHLQVRSSVKTMHTLQATQTRMETYISKPLSINKSQKLDEQIEIMIL
jgi:hypothetical protein